MNTFLSNAFAAAWERQAVATSALSPAILRVALLLGCAGSVTLSLAVAISFGGPQAYLRADPELALLLRGMAVIKSLFVLAAVGVIFWRLGHKIGRGQALIYLVGICLLASATTPIFELTDILLAAVIFHVSGLTLLFTAWRDCKRSGIHQPTSSCLFPR